MNHAALRAKLAAVCLSILVRAVAIAQWDPPSGKWGKSVPTDLRVMTWNIYDGVCSTNHKQEGANDWTALARIVAALKPDFLLLQEAGDNDGNGTGVGVDSVVDLTTTVGLFFHGGPDPFKPGNPTVTAFVEKYAPSYDLPYVFVANRTDNYNRNVIVSRFRFVDLNGDTKALLDDIPTVSANNGKYAPGGNGGIRGFQFAEIDLTDGLYCGDLALGAGHLKSGGTSQDKAERLRASQNVAYVIDYWFNGAGFGIPDPDGMIADYPPATKVLDPNTPVVISGDWNEDELTNGRRGPADWFTQAELLGGTDGTDRDRSDMTYDDARHVFKPGDRSTQLSNKVDYLAWQDSIVTLRRAFLFNSGGTPENALPPEVLGFPNPLTISGFASDHRPVIVDLVFPLCDPCANHKLGDANCDGAVNNFDIDPFVLALTNPSGWKAKYPCDFLCVNDVNRDGAVNNFDIDPFVKLLTE